MIGMYTSNGDYLFPTKLQILSTLETVVLVEKNITLISPPDTHIWSQHLYESPIPEYYKLGEKMIMPYTVERYNEIVKNDVIGNGTHALLSTKLPGMSQIAIMICL